MRMSPQEVIDALANSPDAIQIIMDGMMGKDKHLEHYFGLKIKNGTVKVCYEYFGHKDHIPNKFVDRKLIALHSHVGIEVPANIMSYFKCNFRQSDEFDFEENLLHGTSNPSKEDIFRFILDGHTVWGVCSLYTGYARISFYDPTILSMNDLREILDALTDSDNTITEQTKKETTEEKAIELIKAQLDLWRGDGALKTLMSPPYSAHLIIPL